MYSMSWEQRCLPDSLLEVDLAADVHLTGPFLAD